MLTTQTKRSKKCRNCKNKARWRGVCLGCYSAAKRRIAEGKTTDSKLVAAGFWAAPRVKQSTSSRILDAIIEQSSGST